MDEFAWFVFGSIVIAVGLLLMLGHYYPGSGADVVDWKPTRSPELEAELELQDVDQMLEAQNERRRRDGRPERSEQDITDQVARDEEWRLGMLRKLDDEDG